MNIFVIGGVARSAETSETPDPEREILDGTCREIGRSIASKGWTAVVCSPFEDSADYQILRGVAEAGGGKVEVHFPNTDAVRARVDRVVSELALRQVARVPHHPPREGNEPDALRYAWLLCQLEALDASHAVLAVGGRPEGSANMLLLLAEARRKPVLPVSFLGGAAEQSFYRRRYELQDRLGDDVGVLQDRARVAELLPLAAQLASSGAGPAAAAAENRRRVFFISYPRVRPAEADHVEAALRRRNLTVFRDESEFGAGHEITAQIREAIHEADVFVALWSREYACSPWCADELDLALERHAAGKLQLWIFCVDETRMVPRAARGLVSYPVRSRAELEGTLVQLLERPVR